MELVEDLHAGEGATTGYHSRELVDGRMQTRIAEYASGTHQGVVVEILDLILLKRTGVTSLTLHLGVDLIPDLLGSLLLHPDYGTRQDVGDHH